MNAHVSFFLRSFATSVSFIELRSKNQVKRGSRHRLPAGEALREAHRGDFVRSGGSCSLAEPHAKATASTDLP